ncbi:MAG: 30S ribosomal protein S8 [Elusimicrobia bacterium RIFCSPLOWO2_02_FULL_39_32]|nr:MAG: 30S ribosomal protein S8 [Elusimicrobia bacterium RIFCSPHIGHO2_02_FULL_39_36]OGR93740.1 MAG: 30S ribosomal protein S8 [Elusimicrobia bacterium RIFCSPLOWO2_02_FULL_39_32]OGS00956.1 MAG: 30S ribosomal protein S8 [Elusimicrobia bacterium RIFCSPLOWO2_12_FULL_39_28]
MDPLANFFTSLRNASRKGLEKVDVPFSKIKIAVARVLKEEGYIQNYRLLEEDRVPFLRVQMKYSDKKEPVINGIKRVSRPGLRIYDHYRSLKKVDGGMGVAILSTSKGILANRKARQMKVGGEIICHVW